jgi:dipeptidyl aminopeptidase/acylaminoacyl peptidase
VWQQWDHPDMPWEKADIYISNVTFHDDGAQVSLQLSNTTPIVKETQKAVSAAFPTWASDDVVFFTSDASGYQNPWKYSPGADPKPILPTPVDQDFSEPANKLGESSGARVDKDGRNLLFAALKDGHTVLYHISIEKGAATEIPCPYVEVSHIQYVKPGFVVFIAGRSTEPDAIILANLTNLKNPSWKPLKSTSTPATSSFSRALISLPQPITLKVPPENDPLYVNYYPPTNPNYAGPEGEKRQHSSYSVLISTSDQTECAAPCVLNAHGGPTGSANQVLSWLKQFFTSRGWAWYVFSRLKLQVVQHPQAGR